MTNNQKITNIINVLNRLYPYPPVPLNSRNNFTFLCAVVLSAQTTDGKVNDVTKKLFELASNPQDMSKLSVDVVEQIIKPVGLAPRKASYLVDLSKMIVNQFEGVVPCSYEDLEKLPGVGHKTASVIMSQAFGEPSIAVDTHVHRLALRWGLTKEKSNPDKVQKDLCDLFPREYWNRLHLQMIYFGREYCTAKNHDNSSCPICCWIHRANGEPPSDLSSFPSQKRAKGIVYYADRVQQLTEAPDLSSYSVTKERSSLLDKSDNDGSLSCSETTSIVVKQNSEKTEPVQKDLSSQEIEGKGTKRSRTPLESKNVMNNTSTIQTKKKKAKNEK